ncbi:MSMEG_6728 family protein [Actinoplanes siamensis]|nr:MSMEG_6728 family protein [Actinoplanes siamensis]
MQTFLPYPDFLASAKALDPRRLGKQRVETIQVLRALTVPDYGWRHHPAVLMWRGYEEALVRYGLAMCEIWTATGRADTCAGTLVADLRERKGITTVRSQPQLARIVALPPWLGDPELHRSHQSALIRKDPDFYRPLFGDVPDDLPYVWPGESTSRSQLSSVNVVSSRAPAER